MKSNPAAGRAALRGERPPLRRECLPGPGRSARHSPGKMRLRWAQPAASHPRSGPSRRSPLKGEGHAALAPRMCQLNAGVHALPVQEAGDALQLRNMCILPDAQIARGDAALRRNCRSLTVIRPGPPWARLPRCTRCQSLAKPSTDEYWHMEKRRYDWETRGNEPGKEKRALASYT